jgi:flagellar biogenesis protein FliO
MKMRCWLLIVFFVALSVVVPSSQASAEEAQPRMWSAPGAAPSSGVEPFNTQSSVLRMVGGLFLCFGVLGFGLHVYKRYVLPRSFSTQRRLQVVERLQISQKSALVLVTLDGQEFLMTTGAESSRLISPPLKTEEIFEKALSSACNEVGEYNV